MRAILFAGAATTGFGGFPDIILAGRGSSSASPLGAWRSTAVAPGTGSCPGREVAATGSRHRRGKGMHGHGADRSDARDGHRPPELAALPGPDADLPALAGDLPAERGDPVRRQPGRRCHPCFRRLLPKLHDTGHAPRRHEAGPGRAAPEIPGLHPLPDRGCPGEAAWHRPGLPRTSPPRSAWPCARGRGDGGGVVPVGLQAEGEGEGMDRRDRPAIVAHGDDPAAPVTGTAARLHTCRHDGASGRKEGDLPHGSDFRKTGLPSAAAP